MNFSITILGSGAATPTLARHCSSQAINVRGHKMLIDCGESTQNQLRAYHLKMQSFGQIFISHLHGDHLFGLPGLLASMHLHGRTTPVRIIAPIGIKKALSTLFEISDTKLNFAIDYVELAVDEPTVVFDSDYCTVTAFPLVHTLPTYGYLFVAKEELLNIRKEAKLRYGLTPDECRLVKQGFDIHRPDGTVVLSKEVLRWQSVEKRYAYCCDTAYTEQLLPMIDGVDMLCMECTFMGGHESLAQLRGHCTAAQAATLAQKAGAKRLLLTHFSARYRDVGPLLAEAESIFPATVPAADGAVFEL